MDNLTSIRARMRAAVRDDETEARARLARAAALSASERAAISAHAADLVRRVRGGGPASAMEAFLAEYGLSTREGVALMCLAEAMLRVPDSETIDDLIQDKIAPHDWAAHVGDSGSILVNASTWALMLTGRVLDESEEGSIAGALRGALRRLGEPVIRTAVGRAMKEMGAQFVLGRDIGEAMKRGAPMIARGFTYSYDMLGEAARTEADAARYHTAYADAIATVAKRAGAEDVRANPGVSVKLSALHPRYEPAKGEAVVRALAERLAPLLKAAADARIGLNIDAEEADRLDLSLDVIAAALAHPDLAGAGKDWEGFGVVVQAYGPRAAHAIEWLDALAERDDRRIMVRLVKGAYWDAEIKRAQVAGLEGFPVFTRKSTTDVSYIACARRLLAARGRIYPQFATHNAHTAAAVLHMAGADRAGWEFQRLHGMGESLHGDIAAAEGARCRIYAPVGAHEDLLAYLVRRLLENGANSSFVHQIVDEDVSPEEVAADPFAALGEGEPVANPLISPGAALYEPERRNSRGWELGDPGDIADFEAARAPFAAPWRWEAGDGAVETRPVLNPADPDDVVGHVRESDAEGAADALEAVVRAQPSWGETSAAERGAILFRAAHAYEAAAGELFALLAREAGKTPPDAVAELREAVDFLRYYAARAVGEEAGTVPRGAIICISPWNFPLAIFTGQIAAALSTGNTVVAKPAEQTPLIAARAVALLHEAGIPADALRLAFGDGVEVGAPLVADPRIAGVCFTGSTEVARAIDRQIARSAPADAMLIAETGGLNAMIVDSTALPEQVVRDVVASAFQSAGQRCSALRVLYLQSEIEERVLTMLFGAMDALDMGDPWSFPTDVGPVIDAEARDRIEAHVAAAMREGRLLKRLDPPSDGLYAGPAVVRVDGIGALETEIFGPVLHIARFEAEELGEVIEAINASGYGLTMGAHSRIDGRVQEIVDAAEVGNLYVNRNQIGAVVGSQPFGGEGLSGTGPKAGGPLYLARFRRPAEAASDPGGAGAEVGGAAVEKAIETVESRAAAWAARADRISALRGALRGKAAQAMRAAAGLDAGPVDLPGPTGESNRWRLAPRATALCLGPGAAAALDQAVQALALGSPAILVAPGAGAAAAALEEVGAPVMALDGVAAARAVGGLKIGCAAYCGGGDRARALRRALAERDGPILPLITDRIAPASYGLERAICIDVTAAGGDAALLGSI